MRLNKEMREEFIRNVMSALPKIEAPDYQALAAVVTAEAEAVLPESVKVFAGQWPKFFRRDYRAYPKAWGVPVPQPDGSFGLGRSLNLEVNAAAPINTESASFLAIGEANDEWEAAWKERLRLQQRITATVAAIQTVERLKETFPELAHHVVTFDRKLPVEIDGSNLVAELVKAGMQFSEVSA